MTDKLTNFEYAFGDGSSASRTCQCGKTYFDDYNSGYGWDEDELKNLRENHIAVDHSVGWVSFEGREYVNVCDCWHKRAMQIMNFLDGHAREICDYFKREKESKQAAANISPTFDYD